MVAPVFRESALVWACVALTGGCLAVAVAVWARHFLHEVSEQFIKLPPSAKAVLATAVVVATVFAQKPTNASTNQHESAQVETTHTEARSHGEGEEWGATNQHESARIEIRDNPCQSVDKDSSELRASVSPCETIVSSNDVVRGYRLETVRTNAAISYTRPVNARLVGTWHLTDAYRGRAWVLLGEEGKGKREKGRSADGQLLPSSLFLFPLGPHVVTSLWAHTWGKVRPQLRNASNEIFVIGAPMFARHDQSYLWTAATANGSVLLTWENFFLGNPYERGVASDSHGLAQIVNTKPTALNTEGSEGRRHGEGWKVLNRRDKSDRIVAYGPPRSSNPVNPVKETPCLPASNTSVFSAAGTSTFSESNPLVVHPPINAQLELFPNGDFIARSNSVERVYRRVNPDDWDDDGIPNGADDAPFAPADAPQFGPHQTLPEGANANAYCWVDLVVRQANAKVTFTGDGASNLADPSFIAEADATNRVTLLIGKTYRVTCPMPFEVAAKSSDDIEDSWEEDRRALWLHWPVRIEGKSAKDEGRRAERQRPDVATEISGQHKRLGTSALLPSSLLLLPSRRGQPPRTFTMQVIPSGLGGAFTWTNVCCRISGSDYTFSITCGDSCSCGGCSATGYLEYEGYRLPAYGGFCGCSGSVDHPGDDQDPDKDPPLPGASATFSKRVVFFEDEYENAPGETVPWRSTETELDCWAYGGTRGGHVRIEIRGADGLVQYGGSPLPFECDLEPGEEVTFKNTYRAVRPSGGEDDIVVTATFSENETDWSQTTIDKATAIRLRFRVNVLAPENDCDYRHRYGVREKVECSSEPSEPKVAWIAKGNGFVRGGEFTCPLTAASDPLTARCNGVEYVPSMVVVEPTGVEARDVGAVVYKVPIGHAGGIGMEIPSYALPLDVSFSQIAIEEVQNDGGSAVGYFTHSDFRNWWHHDENTGAGNWLDVDVHNKIGIDYPRLESELYRMTDDGIFVDDPRYGWRYGELNWDNPFGWNEQGTAKGTPEHKRFAVDEKQKMVIFETGRTGVWKLRNVVTRDIDGTVYLNGVKVR